jgi:Ca-activated chloride channel homolog
VGAVAWGAQARAGRAGTVRALPLFLLVAAANGNSQPPVPAAQSNAEGAYRISVDVNMVVLHATVSDRKGHPVSGLRQDDFQVFQDGVAEHIGLFLHEDVPVTVGLVVDHSGSMKTRLPEVVAAADTFARASNPGDQIFVVNFNERVSLGLPAGITFTADAPELESAISRTAAGGKTALYDAIIESLQQLKMGNRDKKVLIVISDGGDNASKHNLPEVMKMAEESSAIIYAIGLFDEDDPDRNPKALENLARATGGEAFFPRETDAVVGICERIARDIRTQYTLGYTPAPAPAKGTYHTILVLARARHRGRLFVRTRAGYMTAANMPAGGQTTEGTDGETRHR